MKFGPQTGARDGGKEFREVSNLSGLDTGSRAFDEEKKAKAKARLAKREAKQARKKGWSL